MAEPERARPPTGAAANRRAGPPAGKPARPRLPTLRQHPSLDCAGHAQQRRAPMKTAARKPNRKPAGKARPRMTRELAEARAVGGGKGKFDGVAFLRTLRK